MTLFYNFAGETSFEGHRVGLVWTGKEGPCGDEGLYAAIVPKRFRNTEELVRALRGQSEDLAKADLEKIQAAIVPSYDPWSGYEEALRPPMRRYAAPTGYKPARSRGICSPDGKGWL